MTYQKALIQAKQKAYLQQSTVGYTVVSQKSNFSSSSVEQKVMYLMSDRNILRMGNAITAIADVLIELRYFKSYSVDRVAHELSICVRNFFNWKDKAIQFFAIRFGLL